MAVLQTNSPTVVNTHLLQFLPHCAACATHISNSPLVGGGLEKLPSNA